MSRKILETDNFRAAYARLITGIAGLGSDTNPIGEAFTAIPREVFIGPAPWQIVTQAGYVTIACEDPSFLYQDFAVALVPERQINNGQPSLHARCFGALQVKPGETVIHVGAGSGYYSAVLARLAGSAGSVIAYEIDNDLAAKAAANLSGYSNVDVRNRSGVEGSLPECDVVYVNAGATAPPATWLDALRVGGRLLFPLTTALGFGAMLLITRTGDDSFATRFVCQVAFIHCVGARDEDAGKKLAEAFNTGGLMNLQRKGTLWEVKSLRRGGEPDNTCWFGGNGWWLSTSS